MALITCPECGNKTSDTAASCPQCGFPMRDYLKYVANTKKEQEIEAQRLKAIQEEEQARKEEEERLRNKPCPECGKVIGDVEICPFCGVNVEEKEKMDALAAKELQQKQREREREEERRKKLAGETAGQYGEKHGGISGPTPRQYVPKCPTCGSTNVKKLGVAERAVTTWAVGMASKKINKSFKCNNCGFTW